MNEQRKNIKHKICNWKRNTQKPSLTEMSNATRAYLKKKKCKKIVCLCSNKTKQEKKNLEKVYILTEATKLVTQRDFPATS